MTKRNFSALPELMLSFISAAHICSDLFGEVCLFYAERKELIP